MPSRDVLPRPTKGAASCLARAGKNAQGQLVVSALFLPFTDEFIEAAVAEDTKKAPEAPEEVTQLATQLEVAMAMQDQFTSTVQQMATDLQQKVRGTGAHSAALCIYPGHDLPNCIAAVRACMLQVVRIYQLY